jgi:hypothetical protein
MVDKKNKNFLTRGQEAQKEREEALKEYSREERHHFRELNEVAHQRESAISMGDHAAASLHEARINSLLSTIPDLTRDRIETTEKMYRRGVRTALGSRATKEDIARHQYSTANYGIASAIASQPSIILQTQIEAAQSGRYALNQDILKESRQLSYTGTSAEDKKRLISSLSTKWQQLEAFAQQEGIAKAGIAIQKRQGTDLASIYESSAGIIKKQIDQRIVRETQAGEYGSVSKINKEFDEKLAQLTKSFEKLNSVIHDATSTEEEKIAAEKQHKQAREEYDKAELKKEAAGAGGVGGSKWGARALMAADILGAAGAVTQAGGAGYRQWAIKREMDTVRLQTGFMGIANQRYQDAQAAAGGDMAAILRIQRGTYQDAIKFGEKISEKEYSASKTEAIGGGMSTAANIAKGVIAGAAVGGAGGAIIGGVGAVPGAIVGGIVGGIGAGVSGVTQTSGRIAELQSGAIKAAAFQDAFNTKMAKSEAELMMSTAVQQKAMDFTRSSWGSTSGAGVGRAGILKTLRSEGFQQNLVAEYGMGQEELLGLTQAGLHGLGKQFRTGDIDRAGKFSRGGFGSSEQYMAIRSQIAQTGGTKDNLETIMRNAVAAGMDSSKNLADMTRTMSSMASFSSAGGVSTFGGAAAGVAASIEALRKSGVNEAMAPGAAGLAGEQINASLNRRAVDIPSLVQSARMLKLGLKPGTVAGEAAAKMKPEQIRTLLATLEDKNATEDQKQRAIEEAGQYKWLKGSDKDAASKVRELSTISIQKAIMDKNQGFAWDKEDQKLHDDYINPEKRKRMSRADRRRAEAIFQAQSQAVEGRVEKIEAFAGFEASRTAMQKGAAAQRGIPYKLPEEDAGLQADRAGALAGLTQYAAGLKEINGSFDKILGTMSREAKNLDPENFKKMVEASAGHLDVSVKALAGVVDRLTGKLGGTPPSRTDNTKVDLNSNANPKQPLKTGFGN